MIEVKKLTKKFGSHTAVDGISFTVNDGEILGFLGPNGAGKTTTMNMMTGFISSTEGEVKINGFDILSDPINAKRQLGYLPDVPPLYGDLTVEENLKFVCDLKGVKKSDRKEMLEEICRIVHIEDVYKRLFKNLSKGYRQRVGLAQALVGFPDVIILDEPTSGLDPSQIIDMRNVIKSLGKKHTVIISSHILSEVSAVCDRVIIINQGKIVASDTTDGLAGRADNHVQQVSFRGSLEKALSSLNQWSAIKDISIVDEKENSVYTINVSGEQGTDIREIIFASFVQAEIPVLMLKPASDSLEDAFINVVNGAYDEVITDSEEKNEEVEEVEIIEESVEVLSEDEEVDE